MDLAHIAGEKRSDTAASQRRVSSQAGGIMRLFPEEVRQIGGEDARHRINQRFPKETLIHCLSSDTPMDLAPGTGKKRRNTGVFRVFFPKPCAESAVYTAAGQLISVSLRKYNRHDQ
jgi:hypothetical protein